MRLRKIISGGQTGADRAALEVARELGLETGGWAPKGYRTEKGPDPSLKDFGLTETPFGGYEARTRMNVRAADFTVIFGDPSSPGSMTTLQACLDYQKPFSINPTPDMLRTQLEELGVEVLNVAGNRESVNPRIGEVVKKTIREAWESGKIASAATRIAVSTDGN